MKKQTTVLLADDNAIVRHGLCALLNADGDFMIVGEARNGREAVEKAQTLRPDIILMDIAMPVLNGLEATRQILAADPAAKVIILSAHSDDEYVQSMKKAGVAGYLEKQSSAEFLTKAIREVAMSNTFFSPAIAKRLHDTQQKPRDGDGVLEAYRTRLTSRESEVLQLVAGGSANKQVAAGLGISLKALAKHRQRLLDKLHLRNTAGLIRYAISAGLIGSSVQLTTG